MINRLAPGLALNPEKAVSTKAIICFQLPSRLAAFFRHFPPLTLIFSRWCWITRTLRPIFPSYCYLAGESFFCFTKKLSQRHELKAVAGMEIYHSGTQRPCQSILNLPLVDRNCHFRQSWHTNLKTLLLCYNIIKKIFRPFSSRTARQSLRNTFKERYLHVIITRILCRLVPFWALWRTFLQLSLVIIACGVRNSWTWKVVGKGLENDLLTLVSEKVHHLLCLNKVSIIRMQARGTRLHIQFVRHPIGKRLDAWRRMLQELQYFQFD